MDLAFAESRLAKYYEAEEAILNGQEYSIDTGVSKRTFRYADLGLVQEGIRLWEARVNKARRGGIQMKRAVPRMD